MPLEEFLSRVAQETGVPGGPSRVELLSGFPPAPLPLPEVGHGRTLASLGLASGDALVARQGAPSTAEVANAEAEAAEAAEAAAARAAAASSAAAASPLSGPDHHPSSAAAAAADWSSLVGGDDLLDEDAALAAAIAASLQDSEGGVGGERGNGGAATAPSTAPLASFPIPAAAAAAPPPRRANNDGPNFGDMRSLIASGASTNDRGNAGSINQGSIPTVSLRDGSAVARRVVDADNSCLFASVGYVMEGTRLAAPKLRALVAKAVVSDPVTYSEAFLGGEFFPLLFSSFYGRFFFLESMFEREGGRGGGRKQGLTFSFSPFLSFSLSFPFSSLLHAEQNKNRQRCQRVRGLDPRRQELGRRHRAVHFRKALQSRAGGT